MLSGGDLPVSLAKIKLGASVGIGRPMTGARGNASHKPGPGLRRRRIEYEGHGCKCKIGDAAAFAVDGGVGRDRDRAGRYGQMAHG